jgi:DNA-binding winged helix-turn-helix (wHTH) protein
MQSRNGIYEFGPFRLEVKERRLLRNSEPVQLRAKVFDTLRVLVENHGKLVSKADLMKAVWPDTFVEEGNLAHNLTVLRKALGCTGRLYVETIPAQGYRFIADVNVVPEDSADVPSQAASEQPALSWEQRLEAARTGIHSKSTAGSTEQARPGSNLVGRLKELAELRAGFESASSAHGLVLCITGEPGIGKSTLFEQFLAEQPLGSEKCVVAVGRCSERLAESEAYLPILEALENLLSASGAREFAELMKFVAPTWYLRVAPLWASADPSFTAVVSDAKAASRERMKRELTAFLREVGRILWSYSLTIFTGRMLPQPRFSLTCHRGLQRTEC